MEGDYVVNSDSLSCLSKGKNSSVLNSGFDSSNNFYYEEVVTTSGDSALPSQTVLEISQRYIADEEADTSVDSGMPYAYRVEREVITALHEFLLKIKDTHFIFFQLIPTTIVIMACKSNLNELKQLMADPNSRHIIYYDKTWRVGGLHVTSLYSRHDHCERENLFPLAFVIHELDDCATHETVFDRLLSFCGCLNSAELLLVTDASPFVVEACKLALPLTKRAASWLNIFEAIKMWFEKNYGGLDACENAVASVKKLLQTATLGEYNAFYEEVSAEWSPGFKTFFDENFNDIVYGSSTGNLLSISMFSKDGLTTVGSREFLVQMEHLFGNSDVAYIDAIAHLAYYMLYYYKNEIEKGRVSVTGFLFKRKANAPVKTSKKKSGFFPSWCAVPGDVAGAILHKMRVGQQTALKTEPPSVVLDSFGDSEQYKELINIEIELDDNLGATNHVIKKEKIELLEADDETLLDCSNGNEKFVIEQIEEMNSSKFPKFGIRLAPESVLYDNKSSSSRKKSRAKKSPKQSSSSTRKGRATVEIGCKLWQDGKVSCDRSSGNYFVEDDASQVFVVRLAPLKKCSCKSKNCQHIVAAVLESMCLGEEPKPALRVADVAVTTICNGNDDPLALCDGENVTAVTELQFDD